MRSAVSLAALLAACGTPPDQEPPTPLPVEERTLGMNDVTMLLPMPAVLASAPVLLRMDGAGTGGAELVPRAVFERLVKAPGDVQQGYDQFHVVALRFDLCDRVRVGPCPEEEDGRLRLVLQPLASGIALDVALHAFYPIPRAELGRVVDELRALGRLQGEPRTSPLKVSPALVAGRSGYGERLRALVLRYARAEQLQRLTLFAQHALAASLNWAFRGVERRGDDFADLVIPDVKVAAQRVILLGGAGSYDVQPLADAPAGLALALDGTRFQEAPAAAQRQALSALAAVDSPDRHTAETVQCFSCHVASALTPRRAQSAGLDPLAIEERYRSPYDLSIGAGVSGGDQTSLRALGWIFDRPAISQRVANDTAQVLTELERRFPAAP